MTAWFQLTGLVCLLAYALLVPGVTRAADLAWGAAAGTSGGLRRGDAHQRERLGRTQRWGVALALVAVVLLSRG